MNSNDFKDNDKLPYTTNASFLLSLLTPLVMFGSCCFSLIGGMGMAFMPLQLISGYMNQPTRPNPEEHVLSKRVIK